MKYQVTGDGDTVILPLEVVNLGTSKCFMAEVALMIPTGMTLIEQQIPKGQFNQVEKAWKIGELAAGERLQGHLKFRVDDAALLPLEVQAQLTSSCTEANVLNNIQRYPITLFAPNLVAGATDYSSVNLVAKS